MVLKFSQETGSCIREEERDKHHDVGGFAYGQRERIGCSDIPWDLIEA